MKSILKKLICVSLALIMVLTVLAACGKKNGEDQQETEAESIEPYNEKLEASFDVANFTFFDDYPGISYATYNGYNNPITEKFIGVMDMDGIFYTNYKYNINGLLTELTVDFYNYDGYAEKVELLRVEYDVEASEYKSATISLENEIDYSYSSTVEYHDNGTMKKLNISQGANKTVFCKEFDAEGRCVNFTESYSSSAYVYEGNSRVAASCTFTEGEFNANVALTHTDGMVTSASLNGGEENYKFDIQHTDDKKNLKKSTVYEYEGTELNDQWGVEFTYNDNGLFSSVMFVSYEDGAVAESEKIEYEYNEKGLMTKQTESGYNQTGTKEYGAVSNVEYDASYNMVKVTEKRYGENDAFRGGAVLKMEYNSDNKVTKRQSSKIESDGITEKLEWVWLYEYDQKGKVSKQKECWYEDGNITSQNERTYSYEYDSKGIVSKQTEIYINYNAGGNVTYKNQRVSEYVDGIITKLTEYEYGNANDRNEVTSERVTTYNADGTSTSTSSGN